MGELPSRASLEMSLLLFTLFSTALAWPAHPCPPHPPTDCGEGMRSCPGEFDPMGCPMPETCVAEGDKCPFICPYADHPHCGFVMSNCAGPVDENGCETPMNCVMVDWAAGEQCPAPEEAAAYSCPPWSPVDCGEGMKSCPGEFDPRGCPMADVCVAEGDECPPVCPHVKHPRTRLAARPLCTVSWSIGLPASSVPPLKRLQQQVAHLGHPLTVEKVTKDKEAVLVSHPASTPGDARCLTSALTLAEGEKCPA